MCNSYKNMSILFWDSAQLIIIGCPHKLVWVLEGTSSRQTEVHGSEQRARHKWRLQLNFLMQGNRQSFLVGLKEHIVSIWWPHSSITLVTFSLFRKWKRIQLIRGRHWSNRTIIAHNIQLPAKYIFVTLTALYHLRVTAVQLPSDY